MPWKWPVGARNAPEAVTQAESRFRCYLADSNAFLGRFGTPGDNGS
jgi:hypothetical protein